MEDSFCEELLPYYPSPAEVEDIHSSYIANCVFNVFLSYATIMLNIITIHAIRKTSSLPKPLKTLLLSLAVSDLGVGFIVQPLYTWLLVKWLLQYNPGCVIYTLFSVFMNLFFTASFCSITVVAVDRILAIQLHLRYQELVTHRRVVAVVISVWVFSALFSLRMFFLSSSVKYVILIVGGSVSLLLTTLAYSRIYYVLRRHKSQIQSLQVQQPLQQATQNVEVASFASLRKSAVGTFYVYLVFLFCYLLRFICLAAFKIHGPSTYLKIFSLYSLTLMFLNSCLNPFIYCWKMKHIRHAIMNTLRNMTWYRNCFLQSNDSVL